jgi:hypothetical protein
VQIEEKTGEVVHTRSGRLILPNFKYGDYVLTKDQKRGSAKAALEEWNKVLGQVSHHSALLRVLLCSLWNRCCVLRH